MYSCLHSMNYFFYYVYFSVLLHVNIPLECLEHQKGLSQKRGIKYDLIFYIKNLISRAAICMKPLIRLFPLSLSVSQMEEPISKPISFFKSSTGKIRTRVRMKLTL